MTTAATDGVTALVLAGSRGPTDPVAAHCGVRHKALAPVAGIPMLARVLDTLASSPRVGRIVVCLEDPAMLQAIPGAPALVEQGRLSTIPPGPSPAGSVGAVLRQLGPSQSLLVTTADHPLLTSEMIEHFCAHAPAAADVAVALAPASVVRAAHPDAIRTFYRLGREGYSGCNLFLFRSGRGERVTAYWAEMERYRKRPWRLVAAIGPLTLLRFLLGRLDPRAAETLLSRRTGAAVAIVEMPFAEAAIDVDKPADLELVERILGHRA